MLLNLTSSILLVTCFSISSGILIIPAPNLPKYATGYPSLTWIASVHFSSPNVVCDWLINSVSTRVYLNECKNGLSDLFASYDCSFDSVSNNLITVVYFKALQTNLTGQLKCNVDNGTSQAKHVTVQDCLSSLPHVTVDAISFAYGSPGIFSCPSNSEMFFSDGTLVTSPPVNTQCLEDATWTQQENIECWNAPSARLLPSQINGTEGESVLLSCQVTGGYPLSQMYQSYMTFDQEILTVNSKNYSITLK